MSKSVAKGPLEEVEKAIKATPSLLNYADSDGMTSLIHAIVDKRMDVIKFLVDSGADVNYQEAAEFLIAAGSSVDARDNFGRNPLMCAVTGYNTAVAELLISKGADINVRDNDGVTALMLATGNVSFGRQGGKKVVHHQCECERCLSHSVIAGMLSSRGAIKYKSKSSDNIDNYWKYYFDCCCTVPCSSSPEKTQRKNINSSYSKTAPADSSITTEVLLEAKEYCPIATHGTDAFIPILLEPPDELEFAGWELSHEPPTPTVATPSLESSEQKEIALATTSLYEDSFADTFYSYR
jgi:Ankyrin repeats (3 copies)